MLTPAFIQYDCRIQLTDLLLCIVKPIMIDLVRYAPEGSTVLLCRRFRETVLRVHQVTSTGGPAHVGYERGRPMPLFRGATSKIILSHMTPRELRPLYETHRAEIGRAGLGEHWPGHRAAGGTGEFSCP